MGRVLIVIDNRPMPFDSPAPTGISNDNVKKEGLNLFRPLVLGLVVLISLSFWAGIYHAGF